MEINGSGRHELKYLVTRDQHNSLVSELSGYMRPDPQGDEGGRYLVTSLYYDTADYKAYWDKIQGHRFRRKLRVRVYGSQAIAPESPCFVEIKQRNNRTVQKKRVVLSYLSAIALCEAGMEVTDLPQAGNAVIKEVEYLSSILQLRPACIVTYDRHAFIGTERDPGLRVTFDTNLKGRTHDLSLLSQGDVVDHVVLPPQWCIMEIKADGHVPYWLTKLISKYRCAPRRISKYCTALEQSQALLRNQRITHHQPEYELG